MPKGSPVSREEFEQLCARVAQLEDVRTTGGTGFGGDESLWALRGLQERIDDPAGAVLLTGSVELQPDKQYRWQEGATTTSLLESDWSELAPALDALAHPVRLQLLQLVMNGTDRTAQLGEAEGLGTSGQLHHHLRQLVAAGWLRSAGRGSYEIPATRVVPLLVVLTAVDR
jgi:hypothetical protein